MGEVCGTWALLSWKRIGDDGSVVWPLGPDVDGLLAYLPDGNMLVQMAARNRPPIDGADPLGGAIEARAAAYSTCLAYFGTYDVRGDDVDHHVVASLYPNWTGMTAARPFTVTEDDLVLRTPPATSGGVTVVNEMRWRRVSSAYRES